MTDTTDIAALLEKLNSQTNSYDTVIIRDFEAKKLVAAFEAERQRAENWSVSFENERFRADKLAAHIEALKRDQVPVALVDERQGSGGFCLTQHGRRLNLQHGTELFTAPQKLVVLPELRQLKEAVDFYLQVQKDNPPIEQGMHKDADEWLKRAAIEAAGGVVQISDVSDKPV